MFTALTAGPALALQTPAVVSITDCMFPSETLCGSADLYIPEFEVAFD